MIPRILSKQASKRRPLHATAVLVLIVSFISSSLYIPTVQADPMPRLPMPGVMVHLSPEFTPALLKGLVIHPENALKFDFIVYKGDQELSDSQKKEEYSKLIKYFLASLAVPDEDQWVNLSPYEKDRIIKEDFGKTEMGRDLLAEDYILKQITASLIYPGDNLGKKFWDKIYTQAYQQFGTTNIPINTFNKVWIVPDSAELYEKGNAVFLIKSHLKVMMEEDYLSLQKHTAIQSVPNSDQTSNENKAHSIASKIVKEIVIPQLETEINEGKNFASLRQVYSGMILAAWYKRALKESLLGQIYANKSRVKGVDQDPKTNEEIYHRYLKAYKKGVFNFIQEDVDKYTNETIPRKYFSGGVAPMNFKKIAHMDSDTVGIPVAQEILSDPNTDDLAWRAAELPEVPVIKATPESEKLKALYAGSSNAVSSYDELNAIGQAQIIQAQLLNASTKEKVNELISAFSDLKKEHENKVSLDVFKKLGQLEDALNAVRSGLYFNDVVGLKDGKEQARKIDFAQIADKAMITKVNLQAAGKAYIDAGNRLLEMKKGEMFFWKIPDGVTSFNQLPTEIQGYFRNAKDWKEGYFEATITDAGRTAAIQMGPNGVEAYLPKSKVQKTYTPIDVQKMQERKPQLVEALKGSSIMNELIPVEGEKREMVRASSLGFAGQDIEAPWGGTQAATVNGNDYFVVTRNGAGEITEMYIVNEDPTRGHLPINYEPADQYTAQAVHQTMTILEVWPVVEQKINKSVGAGYSITLTPQANNTASIEIKVPAAIGKEGFIAKGIVNLNDPTVIKQFERIQYDVSQFGEGYGGPEASVRSSLRELGMTFTDRQVTEPAKQRTIDQVRSDLQYALPDYNSLQLVESKGGMVTAQKFLDALKVAVEEARQKVFASGEYYAYIGTLNRYKNEDAIKLLAIRFFYNDNGYPMDPTAARLQKKFALMEEFYKMNGDMAMTTVDDVGAYGTYEAYLSAYEAAGGKSAFNDYPLSRRDFWDRKEEVGNKTQVEEDWNLVQASRYDRAMKVAKLRNGSEEVLSGVVLQQRKQREGGIDFNAANLNLQIKRDGKGMPLPISQQDLKNIHIDGLIPVIIDIKPASASPLLSQLQFLATQ